MKAQRVKLKFFVITWLFFENFWVDGPEAAYARNFVIGLIPAANRDVIKTQFLKVAGKFIFDLQFGYLTNIYIILHFLFLNFLIYFFPPQIYYFS